ncbi:MAG: adenosylcobinamide-GDP ribazoletransferase [Gaiellaceae bacterium]|nr:adenosylcobinamide-GDP ribazoletransferase [Gaiellaceae bacterium]
MRAVNRELRGGAAAVAFLTRVPVGRAISLDAADVGRGGALFPLVGAGIGAATGGVAYALAGPLTPLLAALLGLATAAVLTGVLHLDALADTADALGAATRERALEIMRDHSIGAYGGVALVLDLGLKAAALAALADGRGVLRFAVCAAAASRAAPVVLSAALPYARPGKGLGRALGTTGAARSVAALGIAALICVAVAGTDGAILLGVAAAVAVTTGLLARRWLGGITGDVLGAAAELSETAALVVAVALA